jgi:Tfp pilus assembly protein PilV
MRRARLQLGMTAVEVLVSTILSAMLMTALIGVLRGLKAHERTLQTRRPEPVWQASLDAALAADLDHAAIYQLTPQALTLRGHGGRTESGASNWLPSQVVYEVRRNDGSQMLVRREVALAGGSVAAADNVVLLDVAEIRSAPAELSDDGASNPQNIPPVDTPPTAITVDTPLPQDLSLEFRSASGETIYRYRHRRL